MAENRVVVISRDFDMGLKDGFKHGIQTATIRAWWKAEDPIVASSVADMAAKVRKECSGGKKLTSLVIVGHGDETGFMVGNDAVVATTLWRYWHEFQRLRPCFGASSKLILGHCKVGRAKPLLKSLSKAVGGVPVMAGVDNQTPAKDGFEGRVVSCSPGGCGPLCTMAKPN
jgi:hypothetical protein